VAYDVDLAQRIRTLVGLQRGLSEKRMFGGLAFLICGNVAIAASSQGGVLVRVGRERSDELVDTTKASVAVMAGRPRAGWLRVAAEDVRTRRSRKLLSLRIRRAGASSSGFVRKTLICW